MNFSIKEIEVLMEAMDSWPYRNTASDLMTSMLESMLMKSPEDKIKLQEKQRLNKIRRDEKVQKDKDEAVLIKAKLIQMKNEVLNSLHI